MSVQAMSWVIEHSPHKGADLLCLMMIANHAHADGTNSYPSVKTLARECRMSDRQIIRIIKRLESSGAVLVDRGAGPKGTHMMTVVMDLDAPIIAKAPDILTPPKRKKADKVTPDNMSGGDKLPPKRGDIAMSYKPSLGTVNTSSVSSDTDAAVEPYSSIEVEIAEIVGTTRGMTMISSEEIIMCYREAITSRASPRSERADRVDAMNFRDYWNDRRKTQSSTRKWSAWRKTFRNWMVNTRELDDGQNGRTQTGTGSNRSKAQGTEPRFQAKDDYDAAASYVNARAS